MSESIGNKTVTGIIWSLIQRFGVMFVSFVTNMILARLLTPDDFGAVGMLLIFISVANTFVDGGFASALIQKKNPTHQEYSTIFYWNLIVSLFFILLLYASAPNIAEFYKIPLLSEILRVQVWVLLINAFSIVQQNILVKRMQFKKLALINLIANIISASVAIKLAYSNYGVWSLVYKNLLSAFVENLGPLITTTVPPSWTLIPSFLPASSANCLIWGQYGSAAETCVATGPSKIVEILPSVQSTNWSHITNSPGLICFCKLPAAQGDITLSHPSDFIAHTFAL